jgi:hypothetical protein
LIQSQTINRAGAQAPVLECKVLPIAAHGWTRAAMMRQT